MIDRVVGMYFSPTGTTEKIVQELVELLSLKFQCEKAYIDFTLPGVREEVQTFSSSDLVIFGTPVYAGRVPNVLLKYIHTVSGGEALAVPIVLFGNRNYDDALAELQSLLAEDGFLPVAAGAFVGEHSFSEILGAGRPDNADMEVDETFADDIYNKLCDGFRPQKGELLNVGGEYPSKGYYQPRDRKGNPVDIRKVKPKTSDSCNNCKLCVKVCPMGPSALIMSASLQASVSNAEAVSKNVQWEPNTTTQRVIFIISTSWKKNTLAEQNLHYFYN